MKKSILLILPIISWTLASCNTGGEYKNLNGTMVYSYWTFSFGTLNDTLPEANASSFESLENWLGHDGTHVYFKSKLVRGADAKTLEADKYPLFHDKSDYYYEGVAIGVKDMGSFKVFSEYDDDMWAKDKHHIYFDSICMEQADVNTFRVMEWPIGMDKSHVFRFGKIIPDADPETFEILDFCYSKDKNHVWFTKDLIEGADPETFTHDKEWDAHNKTGKYHYGKRVE